MNKTILIFSLIICTSVIKAQTITIGSQVWMTKNLDVSTFRNGDTIPQAKTSEEWENAGNINQPAWCYYDNDPANGTKYGKLYNWCAVYDQRGLAPIGYHIPTDEEWTQLTDYLGGENVAGAQMKSKSGWEDNGNGTNSSGFSGLPGDHRGGSISYIGHTGVWWSSSEYPLRGYAWVRELHSSVGSVIRNYFTKDFGFSVRCLRD